jgi:hypothetical protein
MLLTLTRAAYSQIQLTKSEGDKVLSRFSAKFGTDKHYRDAARTLGIDVAKVYELVTQLETTEQSSLEYDLNPPASPLAPFKVFRRKRDEPDANAKEFTGDTPLDALRSAINVQSEEIQAASAERSFEETKSTLLYWDGISQLCAVDIDYHAIPMEKRPLYKNLQSLISRLKPSPAMYWLTHGRGYRLIYQASDGYTADEIAAIAAISIRYYDKLGECELLRITRPPPVKPTNSVQVVDMSAIRRWFTYTDFDPESVAEWLEDRGLAVGQRYDHSQCPIHPDRGGQRQPVEIHETHVRCYICQAKGRAFGSHIPGVFPYAALCGTPIATHLRSAVQNFAHWEHARYVVEEHLKFGGDIGRLAYAAALKMTHSPADPRIPGVFVAGKNFVRFENRWVDLRGNAWSKEVTGELATLPACQYIGENGIKPSPERICRFNQPIDLAEEGYAALVPIWGMRIYSEHLDIRNPNRVNIVVQTASLSAPQVTSARPRYLSEAKRPFTEEQAWNVIERVTPGIYRNAVKAFIAARGCTEGDVGQPPLIFVTGPTSSGKSQTAVVSAAIIGDNAQAITGGVLNEERARQGILESKEKGSFAVFNEAMKRAKRGKISPTELMNFVLNLTKDSLSHKLYVGPVPLGRMPVCVFTDTVIPDELFRDAQISRRIVRIHMPGKVDWECTFKERGVMQPNELRIAHPEYADACNVIASSVIDEFFREPLTFFEIAEKLGFDTLSNSSTAGDGRELLSDFFKIVCNAPPLTNPADIKRWKGRGWKVIDRDQEKSELTQAWVEVNNERMDGDFTRSRRCGEVDWRTLVNACEPLEFEVSEYSATKIAVRFVSVKRTRKTYRVNEELLTNETAMELELESGPKEDSSNRLGNPVGGEFETSWFECLPDAPGNAVNVSCGDES